MAKSAILVPATLNPTQFHIETKSKSLRIQSSNNAIPIVAASSSSSKSKHLHSPLIGKTFRTPRRLITISTADGKWHGNWKYDYLLSLQDLQLQDLIEVEEDKKKNAQVLINLSIQKHASFGLTVDGRITTAFTRKCSCCSSPYCRQIDAKFKVWILMASSDTHNIKLPEIGGDPSVIYVKPGYEADLDSLVQDTIRLCIPVKDTCSELCEKSEATLQYTTRKNISSVDKRWSRLYELKDTRIFGISVISLSIMLVKLSERNLGKHSNRGR